MTSTRRIANPIAVRRYGVAGMPDREVVLTIGKPRPDPRPGGDWMCSVLIEGIPKERRRRVNGADAVQALQMAMIFARHELDASGLPLTWLDGEPGDVDLPLPVPGCWGLEFQRKLESYMHREVKRLNDAVTAFLKVKASKQRRKGRSAT
jgi:hypothetical protein